MVEVRGLHLRTLTQALSVPIILLPCVHGRSPDHVTPILLSDVSWRFTKMTSSRSPQDGGERR